MASLMGIGSRVFGRGATLNATVGSLLHRSGAPSRAGDINGSRHLVWKFLSPIPSARGVQTLVVVMNLNGKNLDPKFSAVYGERLTKAVYDEVCRLRKDFPHVDQSDGAELVPHQHRVNDEKFETAPGSDVISLSFEFLRQRGVYVEDSRRKDALAEEQDLHYVKFFRDDKINKSLAKLTRGVETIDGKIDEGVTEIKSTVNKKVSEAFEETSNDMLGVVNLLCNLSSEVDVLTAASVKQNQRLVEYALKFNNFAPSLVFWYPSAIALGVLWTDGFTPLEVIKVITEKHREYVFEMKTTLKSYQERINKGKDSDDGGKDSDDDDSDGRIGKDKSKDDGGKDSDDDDSDGRIGKDKSKDNDNDSDDDDSDDED